MWHRGRMLVRLTCWFSVGVLMPHTLCAAVKNTHPLPLQFGRPVLGEPLSGVRTLDYEPAKGSPDPVAVHAEERYYRDSAGRTRSEFSYPDEAPTVYIVDPVAHTLCHWTVGDTVFSSSALKPSAPEDRPVRKLDADAPLIEGVPTSHTHTVTGSKEIQSTVESWYAPDLHLAMVTIVDKPALGKTTYRFTHVSRAEPDPALFRIPDGFTLDDPHATPPPPPTVQVVSATINSKPNSKPVPAPLQLPRPIVDNNYLAALTRFHATVPRGLPTKNGYHMHIDVRLIDLEGRETKATEDRWSHGNLTRHESLAEGFHSVSVWMGEQLWSSVEGTAPLHLHDVQELVPRPGPMERRIRILGVGFVAMKPKTIGGATRSCSGTYGGAELCFDEATGFPAIAILDGERVIYDEWATYEGATYPSHLALYRGQRLQMEATLRVSQLDPGDAAVFQPLPGVRAISARYPNDNLDTPMLLKRGNVDSYSYGKALVRVSVDGNGRVRKAELIDADDRSLGKAAVQAAKASVYMPKEIGGQSIPFETVFSVTQWSTYDPIAVSTTSARSQSPD